ncbi:MAG TPA: CoA pyrophosphatase, partial [Rhodobacteraceae bacterium]|nr:CoA pyrophosphatase [Paracoccaceae bacterium]
KMTVPPHELRAHLLTALGRSQAGSSDFDLNPVSKGQRAAPLRDAAVLIGVYSN